jgi:hypothetical protein
MASTARGSLIQNSSKDGAAAPAAGRTGFVVGFHD